MQAKLDEGGVGTTLVKIRQLTFFPKYAQNPKYEIELVKLRARVKEYDLAWYDVPNTDLSDLAYMLQMDGGFVRELKSMAVEDEKGWLTKRQFSCDLCKQKFAYKQKLERHTYSSHESLVGFKMKEVKEFEVKREKKEKGMVDLLREEMDVLKAQKLGEEYGENQEYDNLYEEEGLNSHPPEGSQQIDLVVPKCSSCGHQPLSTEGLKLHMSSHLHLNLDLEKGRLDEQFKCSKCNYMSSLENDLSRHMNAKHLKKQFKCPRCEYMSLSRNEVSLHMKQKHVEEMRKTLLAEKEAFKRALNVDTEKKKGAGAGQKRRAAEVLKVKVAKKDKIEEEEAMKDQEIVEVEAGKKKGEKKKGAEAGQKRRAAEILKGKEAKKGKIEEEKAMKDKEILEAEAGKKDAEAKKMKDDLEKEEVSNPLKQCKTKMKSVAPREGFQPCIALSCKLCPFATVAITIKQGKMELERHTEKHHGENRIEACGYCEETFPLRADNLRRHYTRKHPTQVSLQRTLEVEGQFRCDQCELTYIRQAGLRHHVQQKHGHPVNGQVVQQQPLVRKKSDCPHCDYSSNRGYHMKRHIEALHPNSAIQRVAVEDGKAKGAFQCSRCDITCGDRDALKKHVNKRHHKRDGKVEVKRQRGGVLCNYPSCETVSADPISAELHYQQAHPEARETKLAALKADMIKVIETQDPISLPPLAVVLKANAILHQLGTEISDSKYLCFKCDKTREFPNAPRSESQVKEHLLKDHWNMQGRQCGFCNKIENDRRDLFKHLFFCPVSKNDAEFENDLTG